MLIIRNLPSSVVSSAAFMSGPAARFMPDCSAVQSSSAFSAASVSPRRSYSCSSYLLLSLQLRISIVPFLMTALSAS